MNGDKIEPEETTFRKIGGSIWMKIPPKRVNHLELNHLKEPGKSDETPGKCLAQTNKKGEKYIAGWNPNAESQKTENEESVEE